MKKTTIFLFMLMFINLNACAQKKYFVSFETNGGSLISKQSLKKINYNLEVIPTKDNYIFTGWYFDNEFLKPFNSEDIEKKDITLFAKWEILEFTNDDLIDLYITAYNNHTNASVSEVISLGEVNTKVSFANIKQKIKSVKQVKDNTYYQLTTSFGTFVNVMHEFYGSKDNLKYTTGTTNNNLGVEKINQTETITFSDFKNEFGLFIDELNYIVNHDTVVDVKNHIFVNNNHYFELSLDLEKSVINYVKNIKKVNKFPSEYAKFSKIILKVEIDHNNLFKKITYDEKYNINVKVPIMGWQNQTMKALITETFKYDNDDIIIIRYSLKGD